MNIRSVVEHTHSITYHKLNWELTLTLFVGFLVGDGVGGDVHKLAVASLES